MSRRARRQAFGKRRIVMRLALLGLAIPFALQTTNAMSQSPPEAAVIDDLLDCLPLEDDQRRLECFDERLRQVADLRQGAVDSAQEFTGDGNWQSDPFTLGQEWRLVGKSKTDLLTIELSGPTPLQQEIAVDNQIGSGAGRTPVQEPGHINVRAIGEWQISIVEE
jgi:hypothetical protein